MHLITKYGVLSTNFYLIQMISVFVWVNCMVNDSIDVDVSGPHTKHPLCIERIG